MRLRAAFLLASWSPALLAADPGALAIERALIQRDQQSAEFAAQLQGAQARRTMEELHARQLGEAAAPLSPQPAIDRALRPAQRARMAEESAHVLRLPPPVRRADDDGGSRLRAPLALPGGARPGVDTVAPESLRR